MRGTRLLRGGAGAALILAPAILGATAADAKRHRIRPPGPVLYRSLGVSEREWSLTPTHTRFHAGAIPIRAYNYGMDDHDFAILAEDGETVVASGTLVAAVGGRPSSTDLVATLAPGRYKLVCTLFADQPGSSHEAKGMVAWIRVY